MIPDAQEGDTSRHKADVLEQVGYVCMVDEDDLLSLPLTQDSKY